MRAAVRAAPAFDASKPVRQTGRSAVSARICKGVIWVFAALCLVALAIGLIGTFGWFGQERDPLSWVFVMPLGLPWTQLLGGAGSPWLAVLSPLVNLAILIAICRYVRERSS
jgi:hypothetical protein